MNSARGIKLNNTTGLTAEFLLVLMIVLCTLFHLGKEVSIAFSMTFFVLVAIVIRFISSHGIPWTMIGLFAVTFFNVSINTLLSKEANISFSYFYKLIMFFCTVVFFYMASEMQVDQAGKRRIQVLPLLMGAAMIISYYVLGNRTMIAHSITLGFVNPNFTGMWLSHVFFYAICDLVNEKKTVQKILIGFLAALCLVLIWKAYARSCFAGIFVFAVLLLYGRLLNTNKLPTALTGILLLFPLLFAASYLYVVHAEWFTDMFHFLVRTGKGLTARDQIWRIAFERFFNNPFLGNYSQISRGTGVSQLHNMHIDVLCSYGIVPLMLFLRLLQSITSNINRNLKTYSQYVAYCAFLSVITIGAFEASIVAGSTGLYLLSGGFLILASK